LKTFTDYYNNKVKLSFADHPFSTTPKHVLVICKYNNDWLLTRHKERGLEFPGGKVEVGENAKQAAIREVMEETGGNIESIKYIAQYHVAGKSDTVIKNVYFANIDKLCKQDTYYETDGPVLKTEIPENVRYNSQYSFIMKDEVLKNCINFVRETFK
jgi:8-oxo-dGTP diphosphatase